MSKELKLREEIEETILAELHRWGFPGVVGVEVYQITDPRREETWSICNVRHANEVGPAVASTVVHVARRLQQQIDMLGV